MSELSVLCSGFLFVLKDVEMNMPKMISVFRVAPVSDFPQIFLFSCLHKFRHKSHFVSQNATKRSILGAPEGFT